LDAGLMPATTFSGFASLGDRIWADLNANGIQDPEEGGLPAIKIKLIDGNSGAELDSTRTDAFGKFMFTGLEPGPYYLKAGQIPAAYNFSAALAGGDVETDSDFDPVTGQTGMIILEEGEDKLHSDGGLFLLIPEGSVRGQVWNDADQDGIFAANEKGVPGITVSLFDASGLKVATTSSDFNGKYYFSNIPAGDYRIGFNNLPDGFNFTLQDAGGNDMLDSDPDPVSGLTELFNLSSGQELSAKDAGLFGNLAVLGSRVWMDLDADGIREPNEPLFPGVTLYLLNSSGTKIATGVTNENGLIQFSNLTPGTYSLEFVLVEERMKLSPQDQDPGDVYDSDVDPLTGRIDGIVLNAGTLDLNRDAGLFIPRAGSLGDKIWKDLNSNGLQDPSEPGLEGVTLQLSDSTGTLISVAVTDESGQYRLSDIPDGEYSVELGTLLPGYAFTLADAGSSDSEDSDVDPLTGAGPVIQISGGTDQSDYDGGAGKPSIGNRVWLDLNENGIQDGTETGLSGITISLFNQNGSLLSSVRSDAMGIYRFTDLDTGIYRVGITYPVNYILTGSDLGSNDLFDSDIQPLSGMSDPVHLNGVSPDESVDIGLVYKPGLDTGLEGMVWFDENGDGTRAANETPLSGITLSLFDDGGSLVTSTVTNGEGRYSFHNLEAGTYAAGITLPAGMVLSAADQASTDTTDSDFQVSSQRIVGINLGSATKLSGLDAGLVIAPANTASLGDMVWLDGNQNGIQDMDEPGLGGVTVELYGADGFSLLRTTETDGLGSYSFTGLPIGAYYLRFTGLPGGYSFTSALTGVDPQADSDPDNAGDTKIMVLTAGMRKMDVDAGIIASGSGNAAIGQMVWYDQNRDGAIDPSELGVPGIPVVLMDADGQILQRTVSDPNGRYMFRGIPAGSYRVGFLSLPKGFGFSPKNQAGDEQIDSDAGTNGITDLIELASGEIRTNIGAGIYKAGIPAGTGSLGQRVWLDADQDGIMDADEPGMPGIQVLLYAGDGITKLDSTHSDAAGAFMFTGLNSGNYLLEFTKLPAGYGFTSRYAGGNDQLDSDPDPATGKTGILFVPEGTDLLEVDAGIFDPTATARISSRVWNDKNGNGISEDNEPGVPGIEVSLINASGDTERMVISDESGNFGFAGLPAGSYKLRFCNLPEGFSFTQRNAGADSLDSDADQKSGYTRVISLLSGGHLTGLNAGINGSVAVLGNQIWEDRNGNGIRETGENGISGVTVILYDNLLNPVSKAITDKNGKYSFLNLNPGTYRVGIVTSPGNMTLTDMDLGGDESLDSDLDPATGLSDPIILSPGDIELTLDAGLKPEGFSLGKGTVWRDANANGIREATESLLPGLLVSFYDLADNPVSAALTDGSGSYFFNRIQDNVYKARFVNLPQHAAFTQKDAGGNDASDSDVNQGTGETDFFILAEDAIAANHDAGLVWGGDLGSLVWYDSNRDGILDRGELPAGGVRVELIDSDGLTPLDTVITAADGTYLFDDRLPGTYFVRFSEFPGGMYLTLRDQGGDDDVDSDPDQPSGITAPFALAEAGQIMNIFAGLTNQSFPVELLSFSAEWAGEDALLRWVTTFELNSDYFVVERSFDKMNYFPIGTVRAAGNSQETNSYSLTDPDIAHEGQPVMYYRLKQVDLDGSARYISDQLELRTLQVEELEVMAYPQPATGFVFIRILNPVSETLELEMVNNLGQQILHRMEAVNAGSHELRLDLKDLPAGFYYLHIAGEYGETVQKLILE
jgi:protocatechuate 3,4-dioxygenase beta subunit